MHSLLFDFATESQAYDAGFLIAFHLHETKSLRYVTCLMQKSRYIDGQEMHGCFCQSGVALLDSHSVKTRSHQLFRTRVALWATGAARTLVRGVAERRTLPAHGMIELPDDWVCRVGE